MPGSCQRFARSRAFRDAEDRAAQEIAGEHQHPAGVVLHRRHLTLRIPGVRSPNPESDWKSIAGSPERAPRNDSRENGRAARKEIDAFLARPDPGRPIILLYGPDAGLVRERADALMASAVDDPNDPFSLVRLDGDELSAEPSRLVDEAMTVPLFGGRRAIRVRAGSRSFASGVDTLADSADEGLPHRDRGRRAAARIAAAQGLRARQDRGRDRLLSRRRARSGQS